MRVLVASRSDTASMNIRAHLTGFEETPMRFRDVPVWARSETLLIEIEGPAIHDERLGPDLAALDLPVRDVWFLSRHRAASGEPSLTVHPIGNHHEARFGGVAQSLVPAAPRDMGPLLRRLRAHRDAHGLPHAVTYEATHHGPYLEYPTLFVEVGSDERWYEEPRGAAAVAAAIDDVLCGEGRIDGPILVGVGGGHYVPRMTDKALAGEADFGHLVPAHALGPGVIERAFAATPGAEGVYLHKKGLKGPQREMVRENLAGAGIPEWTTRS